jgi:hypothetical protein
MKYLKHFRYITNLLKRKSKSAPKFLLLYYYYCFRNNKNLLIIQLYILICLFWFFNNDKYNKYILLKIDCFYYKMFNLKVNCCFKKEKCYNII